MRSWRVNPWFTAAAFLLLALVVGIGLVVASEHAKTDTLEQTLLREAGLAFLVASFLGLTFELFQRLHLMHQVEDAIGRIRQEQVTQTLRSLMSDKVFDEVQDHLIRRPLVREYQKITLVLEWVEGPAREYVRSRTISRYKLRNLTEAPVRETIVAFCSILHRDAFPEACNITKVIIGGRVLEGDALALAKEGDYIKFSTEETVSPRSELEVECCYEAVHLSRDMWLWVFTEMTELFELTVIYPAGLVVEAEANHPRGNERFRLVIPGERVRQWELTAASLPGQSVALHWHTHPDGAQGGT